MKIIYLKRVDSTQLYLKQLIKTEKELPLVVLADVQTNGIGSRQNSWISKDGNLFFSFAVSLNSLPSDLRLESISIFFAYILKETLKGFGSKVVLKWPNDFYIDNKKIGGFLTDIVSKNVICGIGINFIAPNNEFGKLDIEIDRVELINAFFKNMENFSSWKQVFSKYKLEFYTENNFFTHENNNKISLKLVKLESDGSISINGKRIYSRR